MKNLIKRFERKFKRADEKQIKCEINIKVKN